MQGIFLDKHNIDRQDLDLKPLIATLPQWKLYDHSSPSQAKERIRDASIIVTNKAALPADILKNAENARFICLAGTGCDHVDINFASAQGIIVSNVRDYCTPSLVQHTIGLMIALAAKIVSYNEIVKKGAWAESQSFCLQNFPTMELAGKVLGIVGYGASGKGVAQLARLLGMKVLVAQRPGQNHPDRYPLTDLLPIVDVLSLHCPLIKGNHHLISSKELAMMKPGSLLINIARGALVDEHALAAALLSGHLGGAAIDVSTQEPPSRYSPLLARPIPQLIVTPHVAWSTQEARRRLLHEVVMNIRAFLRGAPRNVVKGEVNEMVLCA